MRFIYPRRLVLTVLVTGLLFTAAPCAVPAPLRTAGDRPIDVKHIRLNLHVDLAKKTVDAQAALQVRALRPLNSVTLDAVGFKVSRVYVDSDSGQPASFHQDGKRLIISVNQLWPTGHEATIHVDYVVHDPKEGLYFFAPTKANPETPMMLWSQGEAIKNRSWIPCLDQPDQKQTSEIIATVPEGFDVLSNGKLVDQHSDPSSHTATFHWVQSEPHTSYLITLVVGKFDIVKEEWHGKPVLYYVPRGHKAEIAPTFGRTREMLTFFSNRFGIEYPWDKYAQVIVEQFIEGGMENTSATTLTDSLLTDQRSLQDLSPDGITAHELTHQWWGDLVTCRDWAHIWLNEGFATYGEVLWARHAEGPDAMAYLLWQKSRGAMDGDGKGPVVDRHYANPDATFDNRAYPKGGWVLHMLRRRLGEDAFWRGMKTWGDTYRYQSAETSQFREVMEQVSGRSLERFFYDWTERPGHPILDIATVYDPKQKQARVTVKQTQTWEPFAFPLKLVLTCGSGKPIEVVEEVADKLHVFTVPLPGPLTMIEVDPGQTLLAEIRETKPRDLWVAQMLHAASVPARIRAVEHFAGNKVLADRKAMADAYAAEKFWGVKIELARALQKSGTDVCRDALIHGLADANPKVRRACADALGAFSKDKVAAAALKALLEKGEDSYAVRQAAIRSYAGLAPADALRIARPWLAQDSYHDVLRRAALSAIGASNDPTALDTVVQWAKTGHTRAVRSAAINALGSLLRSGKLNDTQIGQAVQILIASLKPDQSISIRRSALFAMRDLGLKALPALKEIEEMASHESDARRKEMLTRLADSIKRARPSADEVKKLQGEVERLRKENNALKQQLKKLDKAA